MPREYAQIKLGIWADDDFRALSPHAQHLYMVLLTQPSLSHCGAADWRPNRIAALSAGWSSEDVCCAGKELEERGYLVIDEATEEVLIRSYIRNDGLMKQPKMAVAMATAHAGLASSVLRGVVVHEMKRLREDFPDLNGWGAERASALLALTSVDPFANPFGKGFGKGKSTPSVKGSPTPVPAPTPAPSNLQREPASRRKPEIPLPEDWRPSEAHKAYCQEHRLDLSAEVFKFRNHCVANDRRQRVWNATFSTWLAKALEYRGPLKSSDQIDLNPWMTR